MRALPQLPALCLASLTLLTSCGDPVSPPAAPSYSGSANAVCPGGPTITSLQVWPQRALLGPASNAIVPDDQGALWIVESGQNTISRVDEAGFSPNVIDVGGDQNPYDVTFAGGKAYTANYLGQSISVADQQRGTLESTIQDQSLKSPSAVAVLGEHLYVGNANYLGPQQGYGPASLTIFERETLKRVGQLELPYKNAQFLRATTDTDGQPMLLITSTGELGFRGGSAQVVSQGALTILKPDPIDALKPTLEHFPLPMIEADPRQGAPGRPMHHLEQQAIYLTSATTPSLYKLDLRQRRWLHDTQAPLIFDDLEGDALHHGTLDAQGLIYITSFNQDALFVFDTRCDKLIMGPIPLGVNDALLEGPHGAAILEQGPQGATLYYITSLSNTLGRIDVRYDTP